MLTETYIHTLLSMLSRQVNYITTCSEKPGEVEHRCSVDILYTSIKFLKVKKTVSSGRKISKKLVKNYALKISASTRRKLKIQNIRKEKETS